MPGSSFGNLFRVTSFGESHGPCVGVVVEGCPAGLKLDMTKLQSQLLRRRPGQSKISSQRKEGDQLQIFSGIFQGMTTGTPIMAAVFNQDARSQDYSHIENIYRPSHADYTWEKKFGHRDHRGGGRASARETVARVIAGAIAQQVLDSFGIIVRAAVSQVAGVKAEVGSEKWAWNQIEDTAVRCPDLEAANGMIAEIELARKSGDSLGGIIFCEILHVPPGLGEPVFDKLTADLAKAMMSINAARGFEIGAGFACVTMKGSEHNDAFVLSHEKDKASNSIRLETLTNNSGGIQGGISNGMPIYFRVAFKPVATIMKDQMSVNSHGETVQVKGRGRHDPCVVPRAVPIVETMAAIVILDHLLRSRINRLEQVVNDQN
ncbi:MAG: chorismate synthase [Bdellovibrionales bacterium]|nr:chorismate synthase [Bdellovibrionales bacterium]